MVLSNKPNQDFVTQVYLDLLERPVEPSGLTNWTSVLDQGVSRTLVVQAIASSSEYKSLVVEGLYNQFLERPAEPGGLKAFSEAFARGATVEQIEAIMAGSPEYYQNRGGATDDGFLGVLYHDALKRTIDPAGADAWAQALDNGSSPTDVALAILASNEFRRNLVQSFYARFLRRSADDGGLNGWTNALQHGARDADVISRIAGSDEYFQHVQDGTFSDLLQGSVDFAGPYPQPAMVTFTDSTGQQETVVAFPGQVQVFFRSSTSQSDAANAIQAMGGTILAQIPRLGEYLVGVPTSQEGTFISRAEANPRVEFVAPDVTGTFDSKAFVFDNPYDHGKEVAQYLDDQAAAHGLSLQTQVRDISGAHDANAPPSLSKIEREFANLGRYVTGSEPLLVNLSVSGGLPGQQFDWTKANDVDKKLAQDNWAIFLHTVLEAIHNLPPEVTQKMAVTLSASNEKMPVDNLITRVKNADPNFVEILEKHVQIVTNDVDPGAATITKVPGGDPNIVIMTNDKAKEGNSFASPAALVIDAKVIELTKSVTLAVQATKLAAFANAKRELHTEEAITTANVFLDVMQQTPSSEDLAVLAAKLAIATNAKHQLVASEAIDKAHVILAAQQTDSSGSANVTAIAFTSTGTVTAAVITPAIAGVTIQYTVSGTDGYYASGDLQTGASGKVTFNIPPGAHGVVDTISVAAVVSGKIAKTTFKW